MNHTRTFSLLVLALAVGPWLGGRAAAGTEVKVGSRVANLTFKDIHFLPRSLDELADKKAVVLIFTNTSCPLVQRYFPTLKALEKEYRAKGVQFLAVNVGADDTILTMAAQAVRFEVSFPFVKDFDARAAAALGVDRTPTAVVLDSQRRLCYRGRIDDQYRLVGTRAAATRHDLREALDAVLAGQEVAVKETPVDGCRITPSATPHPDKPVTFAGHVAPILRKHCQECHRPGTTAPFPLISYKQVASRADMVAEVVAEGRMPPWFASPEHDTFINRRALTADERDTLLAWVRAGTPRGDDSRLPQAPPDDQRDGKWLIGTPDLIVRAPEHQLPASGDVPYKYVMLPYVFKDETWIQGVQILPDNPRVLHHCNMAHVQLTKKFDESNFITGTVPGGSPVLLRQGLAMRIPKGSTLVLQIHYVTTGRPERCQISVGLRYAREVVQKETHHVYLDNTKFAIPPGAPAHPVSSSKVLDRDAIGIGMFAHMHLRGRDMTFRAHYPDGKTETLLVIPNYSFDWQIPYVWEPGKKQFPKGTRLECIAHYDNSPFNPFNPDPAATVREGPQTHHEMLNGFVFYMDAHEQLNLKIDPKTGRVQEKAKSP